MDLSIRNIPHEVNKWIVTRAIALVLHSEDFAQFRPVVEGRLINFRVKLNLADPPGSICHDGTGLLTVPMPAVGAKFLAHIFKNPIKINEKKLLFKKVNRPPEGLVLTLRKTPYINPDIEEARDKKVSLLDTQLRVTAVQFGLFFQQKYPPTKEGPLSPPAFSIEWESRYESDSQGMGQLSFDYDRKLIRINVMCTLLLLVFISYPTFLLAPECADKGCR